VLQLSTADAEEVAEHESENIKRVARLMKVRWPECDNQSCSAHSTQLSHSVPFTNRQCALFRDSIRSAYWSAVAVRATSDGQLRSNLYTSALTCDNRFGLSGL
jgi:hypothetical protein